MKRKSFCWKKDLPSSNVRNEYEHLESMKIHNFFQIKRRPSSTNRIKNVFLFLISYFIKFFIKIIENFQACLVEYKSIIFQRHYLGF